MVAGRDSNIMDDLIEVLCISYQCSDNNCMHPHDTNKKILNNSYREDS